MYYKIQETDYLGKQIGIGYKGKKMYSDEYINEWRKAGMKMLRQNLLVMKKCQKISSLTII